MGLDKNLVAEENETVFNDSDLKSKERIIKRIRSLKKLNKEEKPIFLSDINVSFIHNLIASREEVSIDELADAYCSKELKENFEGPLGVIIEYLVSSGKFVFDEQSDKLIRVNKNTSGKFDLFEEKNKSSDAYVDYKVNLNKSILEKIKFDSLTNSEDYKGEQSDEWLIPYTEKMLPKIIDLYIKSRKKMDDDLMEILRENLEELKKMTIKDLKLLCVSLNQAILTKEFLNENN